MSDYGLFFFETIIVAFWGLVAALAAALLIWSAD